MLLVTGGLGFIGSHTTRALLDRGETCVLAQRRAETDAPLFPDEVGERVHLERVDVTDRRALFDLGERHEITGIVHLAGAYFGDPVHDARANLEALLNLVEAARTWNVRRMGVASSIGVYDGGGAGPQHEAQPLPLTAHHAIAASKKVDEILVSHLGEATGVEIYSARIGAIWGPLGRATSRFFALPQLVHAAVAGEPVDVAALPGGVLPYAEDGIDLLYVRDCGRALACLQLADQLQDRVYNVSGGRMTTYGEVADALTAAVPGHIAPLQSGGDPDPRFPAMWLDISRLRRDTGYEPSFDTTRAVVDYVAWIRSRSA
ncbi:NAD(P)-dependent oxidoreductase [Actinospica durhamensis]|uniref:NAD(P)-dependent oxidoreductase n=1 Tax=Actinospica durhamensis TaxID=1508375 RepID=A0A941ILU8_9ACTN|nr:NAD(P)-dependent oxidoreductase [Actinospica durhamensis]MBR7833415.1 NAD(P)-dependent oxidoreductase [Actinospica durhamensis]